MKFSGWKNVFNVFQLGKFFPIFVNMSTQKKKITNDSNMCLYIGIFAKLHHLAKKVKQRCMNGIKFVLILVYIKKN